MDKQSIMAKNYNNILKYYIKGTGLAISLNNLTQALIKSVKFTLTELGQTSSAGHKKWRQLSNSLVFLSQIEKLETGQAKSRRHSDFLYGKDHK